MVSERLEPIGQKLKKGTHVSVFGPQGRGLSVNPSEGYVAKQNRRKGTSLRAENIAKPV